MGESLAELFLAWSTINIQQGKNLWRESKIMSLWWQTKIRHEHTKHENIALGEKEGACEGLLNWLFLLFSEPLK